LGRRQSAGGRHEEIGAGVGELLTRHGRARASDRPEAARRTGRGGGIAGAPSAIPFELQTPDVFEECDLIVLSPDVPADLAPLEAARARGVR
jgi:UDP-N-acetylmuramoylalanine-D-glutamate ligase